MPIQMSSREFNQDTSGAKAAAQEGPVYITDRGRPAHVLMTFEDYERLVAPRHLVDLLGEPAGIEDVELVTPASGDLAHPADFD